MAERFRTSTTAINPTRLILNGAGLARPFIEPAVVPLLRGNLKPCPVNFNGRQVVIGEPTAVDLARLKYWNGVLRLEARTLALALKAGYRANQLRVPRGNPDGGQWTVGGERAERVSGRPGRPQQNNSGQLYIAGRWQNVSLAQSMIITVSYGRLNTTMASIRRIDPNWKPTPQFYETVPAYIRGLEWNVREAQFQLFELTYPRIGPGRFAAEWIPAPLHTGPLRRAEQNEINRIGKRSGCHWCGKLESGTPSGNFIGDHQVPRSMGKPTRLYPHCLNCSQTQGGRVSQRKREK